MDNYLKTRRRIFDEEPKIKTNRSSLRARKFWNNVKQRYKVVSGCVIGGKSDIRPYAEVLLFGEKLLGLLDTGASISCIGADMAERFLKSGSVHKKISGHIRTADGMTQKIVGFVRTKIIFRSIEKPIDIYIIPSLTQPLYLGIDFWTSFNLLPDCFRSSLSIPPVVATISNDPLKTSILTDVQKLLLEPILSLFPSFSKEGLGRTSLVCHHIDIGNAKAIKQRHYPVSPAIEKLMYEEVDRMIGLGIIEESNSAWSSPVVLVRKPGKNRLCLDSRKLNEVTVKDAYPLPNIEGILSRLPKAKFITSLDLKDAFWQIPLDPISKDKTAFTVPGRPLYQYKVMPFGLCNAPQTMSRLMDKVIPANLRNEVFIYLDDLLVVSDSFENHMKVLTQVADCLRKSGLTINIEKSNFCMEEVKYLGHVLGNGVIRTDPDKISAIVEYPVPRSIKDVRRFLGMSGWYRKFISNYASITTPLTDLLKNRKKFVWDDNAQKSFEELKCLLSSAPVLHSPDFARPFYIHCDASKTGIGSVLVQVNSEGDEVPVAFMSKKLNKAQRNYSVTEQECLAAVLSIKKFRPYIEGHEFTVVTDHASLKWLMSQNDLSSRLARWALKLQGFNFRILHRKGSQNIVPDALSRTTTDFSQPISTNSSTDINISSLSDDNDVFVALTSPYFRTEEYKNLIRSVNENNYKFPDIKVLDNLVYRRTEHANGEQLHDDLCWKLWLPQEMIQGVLRMAHDDRLSAHFGINKTLARIRKYYFWPGLVNSVKDYINNCDICKGTKHPNIVLRPPMGKPTLTDRLFQKLYIDFIGPYPRSRSGNIGIFVVLDHFSKYPFLKPVRKMTADVICKYLEEDIFHMFGIPETIVSDNGVQFKSKTFQELLRKYNIYHTLTAIYSPQANASERINRSVIAAIRAYVRPDQRNWDEVLSSIGCALRSSVHASIGVEPYYLTFGQQMITNGNTYSLLRQLHMLEDRTVSFSREDSIDIIRKRAKELMEKQFKRNERTYNLRSRDITFKEGETVFRRNFRQSNLQKGYNAKLDHAFIKARIRKKLGKYYYEVEDMQGKLVGKYHAKDLKL